MREDFHDCPMSNPKGNYMVNHPARAKEWIESPTRMKPGSVLWVVCCLLDAEGENRTPTGRSVIQLGNQFAHVCRRLPERRAASKFVGSYLVNRHSASGLRTSSMSGSKLRLLDCPMKPNPRVAHAQKVQGMDHCCNLL